MSSSIAFSQIVTVEELLKRWKGCTEAELFDLVESGSLKSYIHAKSLLKPDGEVVHYCTEGCPHIMYEEVWGEEVGRMEPSGYNWYNWDGEIGVVFEPKDVEHLEANHPEFTYQLVDPKDYEVKDFPQHDDEWVKSEEVRRIMRLSPADFILFLNSGVLQTDREQERRNWCKRYGYSNYDGPFFDEMSHEDLLIYRASWENYCQKNSIVVQAPSHFYGASVECLNCEALKTKLANARAEVDCLKGKVRELAIEKRKSKTIYADSIHNKGRLARLIQVAFVIKENWKSLGPDTQIKQSGYSEAEVQRMAPSLTTEWRRALVAILPALDVKVWGKRGTRPSPSDSNSPKSPD